MSYDNAVLFQKHKLVPIEQYNQQGREHVVGAAERHLRKYDPTLRSMANTYVGMQNAMFGKNARGLTGRNKLMLLNSNKARYLRMLKSGGSEPVQPVQAFGEQNEIDKKTEHPSDEKFFDADDKPAINPLLAIPTNSLNSFKIIMNHVGDAVRPGPNGEVVINNEVVPGTSFSDVMRGLFVNVRGKNKTPLPGLSQTVSELKRRGVPSGLLKANKAKYWYRRAESPQVGEGSSKKPKKAGSGKAKKKSKQHGKGRSRKMHGKMLRLY